MADPRVVHQGCLTPRGKLNGKTITADMVRNGQATLMSSKPPVKICKDPRPSKWRKIVERHLVVGWDWYPPPLAQGITLCPPQ